MEKLKAYKGFNLDMTCKGKKYAEGETYKEKDANVCTTVMHACEYPLDVFEYYPPGSSVYHEVEKSGNLSKSTDDSKVASTELKIGAKLDICGLVHAAIEYTKSRCTTEFTDPKLATAGYRGAATAGDYGAATSRGKSASGKNGLSVARGNGCMVKGGIGAILVIAEESQDTYDVESWKAVIVDGKKIKADTWYKLDDGDLVEVKE